MVSHPYSEIGSVTQHLLLDKSWRIKDSLNRSLFKPYKKITYDCDLNILPQNMLLAMSLRGGLLTQVRLAGIFDNCRRRRAGKCLQEE